jgi:PAS domain S-box-containing protein
MVVTMQDITVRKRIEQALEESLDKYRNIYNRTPVMMHSVDRNATLVSVSDYWLKRMGYQRHEVIGKPLKQFLTPDSQKMSDDILPVSSAIAG